MTILHIDSSARHTGSTSRELTREIAASLGDTDVIYRDLSAPVPIVTEDWIGANFTPADERSQKQKDLLATSDALIDEIKRADTLVIGAPMYNFSIPANLKAWIDQIARAGVTFQYTENGPVGLLKGKKVIVAMSTGGSPAGSDIDFESGYLRHIFGFVGIDDIEFVVADKMMIDPDGSMKAARDAIARLAA